MIDEIPWATGPFTRAEARDAGLGDNVLARLCDEGVLRRRLRGVYHRGSTPDTVELRCAILRIVVPDGYFVCDRTAAWLHVGDRALAPNEHLRVPPLSCFAPPTSTRLRNELTASGRRNVRADELQEVHGLLVTTPLRTALDLGRLAPSLDLRLAGMDAMLSLGVFEHRQLLEEIPRFKGERGVIGLRDLAPQADGGSESFGESASRRRWRAAGLPRPETQVPVDRGCDEVPFRIDIGLRDEKFGAEYDGEVAHGPDRKSHDAERRSFLHDRNWSLEVFRRENVFGQRQDAELRLRVAWAEHTGGRRVYLT